MDGAELPRHLIAVSALVRDNNGAVLLVRTHARQDTWELPGGHVEEGEALDVAIRREFLEETGLVIRPMGITGVYYNTTTHMLSVVFLAELPGGDLVIQADEIFDARFVLLDEGNIDDFITRPHMKSRTLDALSQRACVPYETWETEPFRLIGRLNVECV